MISVDSGDWFACFVCNRPHRRRASTRDPGNTESVIGYWSELSGLIVLFRCRNEFLERRLLSRVKNYNARKAAKPVNVNMNCPIPYFLNRYGKFIAQYNGNGVLTIGATELSCHFEAGQRSDGEVLIILIFNDIQSIWKCRFAGENDAHFKGQTSDGQTVESSSPMYAVDWLPDEVTHAVPFVVKAIDVVRPTLNPVKEWRFGLINLVITPTETYQTTQSDDAVLSIIVDIEGNNVPIRLMPVPEYESTIRELRTLKTVNVTCEAAIDASIDIEHEILSQAIENISYVLSIARGTKITWIYRDDYDIEGVRISRKHIARKTQQYNGLSLIDDRMIGCQETANFIRVGLPIYQKLQRSADVQLCAAIETYLAAKSEQDYLETRAVKVAVALECLRALVTMLPYFSASGVIIEEGKFRGCVLPQLKKAVAEVLNSCEIRGNQVDALANSEKLTSLNRRSFRYLLTKLLKHVRLGLEDQELEVVIKCRDSLVHTGRFYCQSATGQERADCALLSGPVEEYFFLVHFLDRLFLKLLGYSGTYINWSNAKPTRALLP